MTDATSLTIRRASQGDLDSLIEAIIEAEKSGTDIISYCGIFSMNETELREMLTSVLEEDFQGQELCISGFLVGEIEGQFAGTACAWVEGAEGFPSALMKANLLQHFVEDARLKAAQAHFEFLEQLVIHRAAGAIQLESIYVRPAFRGQRVMHRILSEHLRILRLRFPDADRAQILLMKRNTDAQRAYEALGFRITQERKAAQPPLAPIVPGDTRILMEKLL